MRAVLHFINGARVDHNRHSPVFNPATGEVAAEVPLPSRAFIDVAVDVARTVFVSRGQSSLSRRSNILFTFRMTPHHRCVPMG
jgi:malonate-semialdehyde dehydrogenase (acetylating)/methylmalonate-semialdehyde dehydrogenase